MQPPEGPPVCTALNLLAVGNAAADLVDDLAQRDPHGHFDQSRVVDPPGQREDLGALALFRADGGEPLCAVAQDGRNVGERLHVVDQRGASPQPASARDTADAAAACRVCPRSTRSARSLRRTRTRPRPAGYRRGS